MTNQTLLNRSLAIAQIHYEDSALVTLPHAGDYVHGKWKSAAKRTKWLINGTFRLLSKKQFRRPAGVQSQWPAMINQSFKCVEIV